MQRFEANGTTYKLIIIDDFMPVLNRCNAIKAIIGLLGR